MSLILQLNYYEWKYKHDKHKEYSTWFKNTYYVHNRIHRALEKNSHDEKTTQEFYDIIASESNRLLKMVNDILYTSQHPAEQPTDVTSDMCNINIEINKYVKSLAPLAEKNNINIDINVNAKNIYVSMPEIKVARILTNIIENAIKYNKRKG